VRGMGEVSEPRVLGAGWRAMLAELRWRAERAYNLLGELFSEQKSYFREKAELLIRELDLPSAKALMLLDFAEKLVDCLYRAYPQSESKLRRLPAALERDRVRVKRSGRKTPHIVPEGEEWHVSVCRRRKGWIFHLPIHGISARRTSQTY